MYKPGRNQWFASITVDVPPVECKFGDRSDLNYESIVAFDLGTETAITLYDGDNLEDCGCLSSTNLTGKRKHTGSMQQLGQKKRQKSGRKSDGILAPAPSVFVTLPITLPPMEA